MTPTEIEGVTIAIFAGVGLMSAGVWGVLFFNWHKSGTLLPYMQRSPVRWGPLGLAVALFFVATTIAASFDADGEPPPLDKFLIQIWGYSAVSLSLIGLSQLWLKRVRGISASDLGWPPSGEEWKADLMLGFVAAIALVGPVYAIQIGLVSGLGLKTQHDLINAFQAEPRFDVALAVSVSAVIAAPIFEELLFRQLVQGWLERLEEEWLAWRRPDLGPAGEETIDEEIRNHR